MMVRVGILTLSDRAAAAQRADASGPALAREVQTQGWEVLRQAVLPDDTAQIRTTLEEWADSGQLDLILTTGGTGLAKTDVTPEATRAVIQREVPGLAEVMRAEGLTKNRNAVLSRAIAGTRGRCLIINLPGSPRGAIESLQSVLSVLGHAVELLAGDPGAEASHGAEGSLTGAV